MDLLSAQQLSNLYLFAQVIEAGSFASAARELGTTRSLVSRRITDLERHLDAQLLTRNARHFSITPVGEKVYRQAILMRDAAYAAFDVSRDRRAGGRQELLVGMDDALVRVAGDALAGLSQASSELRLVVRTLHGVRDGIALLLDRKADITLHLSQALPDDSSVTAQPLALVDQVLVATPRLTKELKPLRQPQDIDTALRLCYHPHDHPASEWRFQYNTRACRCYRLVTDQLEVALQAARAGVGVAQIPRFACTEELAQGRLEVFMEDVPSSPLLLYALTRNGVSRSKATHRCLEILHERLKSMTSAGFRPFRHG